MLESKTQWEKIEISRSGVVRIVEVQTIIEDGKVIARKAKNSKAIEPGEILKTKDVEVFDTLTLFHTPERIQAYQAAKAEKLRQSGIIKKERK